MYRTSQAFNRFIWRLRNIMSDVYLSRKRPLQWVQGNDVNIEFNWMEWKLLIVRITINAEEWNKTGLDSLLNNSSWERAYKFRIYFDDKKEMKKWLFLVVFVVRSSKFLFKNTYIPKVSLEGIKSLQCYDLTRSCNPLPSMLGSSLTYAILPWSVHCKGTPMQKQQRILNYNHFRDMFYNGSEEINSQWTFFWNRACRPSNSAVIWWLFGASPILSMEEPFSEAPTAYLRHSNIRNLTISVGGGIYE